MTVRARCPLCDELVEISPTGKKQREGFSAEYWRFVLHADPKSRRSSDRALCPGGGEDV